MELFYDVLVPYMPDTVKSETGEMVSSETLSAGRKAMMELSEFQLTGNLMALYQAVLSACKYAEKDFVDTLTNIPDDMTVDKDSTVRQLVDESAIMLFKSINPEKYPFDLNRFVVNIMVAAHLVFIMVRQDAANNANTASEEVKDDITAVEDSKEESNG